jgi:hypothetical protein
MAEPEEREAHHPNRHRLASLPPSRATEHGEVPPHELASVVVQGQMGLPVQEEQVALEVEEVLLLLRIRGLPRGLRRLPELVLLLLRMQRGP